MIFLKYIPRKADVLPNYLLIKHSHSSGSKYFSRCFYMMFALVWMHFEVNFHISKPFGFSNIRRRCNGATSLGPLVFDNDISMFLFLVGWCLPNFSRPETSKTWTYNIYEFLACLDEAKHVVCQLMLAS